MICLFFLNFLDISKLANLFNIIFNGKIGPEPAHNANLKRCFYAKAKFGSTPFTRFALDLKSTPVSWNKISNHSKYAFIKTVSGYLALHLVFLNISFSYLVSLSPARPQPCLCLISRPQFCVTSVLFISNDFDALYLIPFLEIQVFLGAIKRRLRSVCAIPHPNGHCSVK